MINVGHAVAVGRAVASAVTPTTFAPDLSPSSPSRTRALLEVARRLFNAVMSESIGHNSVGSDHEELGAEPVKASSGDAACEPCEPREDDCPICLAALSASCVRTPCSHYFHQACLDQYFLVACEPGTKARCPLCRSSVHAPLPVEAEATSGRAIEVVAVPPPGARCHFDRPYYFESLGGFSRPGMLFVMASNEDRKTPASRTMWAIVTQHPTTVHLNFRSEQHVHNGGSQSWLAAHGWRLDTTIESTVSSGVPNGPYSGPVFTKSFPAGRILLRGSDNWEGTYFVFLELGAPPSRPAAAANHDSCEIMQSRRR